MMMSRFLAVDFHGGILAADQFQQMLLAFRGKRNDAGTLDAFRPTQIIEAIEKGGCPAIRPNGLRRELQSRQDLHRGRRLFGEGREVDPEFGDKGLAAVGQ